MRHDTTQRPLRVLVIDDCRDAAGTLAILLRASGHEVLVAYDGREGLDVALRHCPDVVVCDIGLPALNGYEVARSIRSSPGIGHPLLIAATGYGRERDRVQVEEAGFDFHFIKPYDADRLSELFPAFGAAAEVATHPARLALVGKP
jgi:CheY-like chemotaxis protein